MTGTPSRTARVPIVRWDLKEAEGKILGLSGFPNAILGPFGVLRG